MDDSDPVLRHYERQLRRALRGLPQAAIEGVVDDTVTRLRSVSDAKGPMLSGIRAVGAPHKVAGTVVTDLVRPGDGDGIVAVPRLRRAAGWLPDAFIAWGPLVAVGVGSVLQGLAGALSWAIPAAMAAIAWGAWYWLGPRGRSVTPGLRVAGLTRLRIGAERITVRTADLAEALARREHR